MRYSSFFPRKWLAFSKYWDNPRFGTVRLSPLRPRLRLETLEDRCTPTATVSGTVYEDFTATGVLTVNPTIANAAQGNVGVASDVGVAGSTVTLYGPTGAAVGTATTAANGAYSITDSAGTATTSYRVEFTNLPAGFTDGPVGTGSGTSVQFVTGSSNNVNLGLLRASDYSGTTNPTLYSQIYLTGDPSLPGTITFGNGQTFTPSANATDPALVSFSYSAGTTNADTTLLDYQNPSTHTISVPVSAIGSTFGLAFNSSAQKLYASAYTKRFSAYGPGAGGMSNGDPGAIYMINPTTGAVSLFASIPNLTNFRALTGVGDVPYTNNSSYVSDNGSDPTNPNLGWQSVGTTSLGGMDINTTGTQLYVMDLQHRTLDVLGIKPDGTWDGTLTSFAVPIPTDASAAANMRPFAVHYYNGQVYIGEVDSAQSTQNAAQLRGYVFAFNPATSTFNATQVLEFSLNYARGASFGGSDNFLPWSNTYANINGTENNDGPSKYPQPMLTGLAFDPAGNLSIGIRDRTGDQTARFLESDGGHDPNTQEGISSGATLRAAPNVTQTTWTIENNGSSGGVTTGGANIGFGPGGGQYYYQDNYANSATARNQSGNGHNDVSLGGVLQVPGFPDLVVTSFDPDEHSGTAPGQTGSYRTGGVRFYHNANDTLGNAGTENKAYMLYAIDAPGTFGKADGIGNVVAQTFPAPLEIGNRLWKDANGNGIEDPTEPALANVTVTLYDVTSGTTVGNTTTDANGDYLFNNSNVTGGLLASHSYEVRISATQTPLNGLIVTPANKGSDALINSKAAPVGTVDTIAITTGTPGQINHTLDAGFEPAAQLSGEVFDNSVEDDGVFHSATDPGINGVTVTLTGTDDLGNAVNLTTTTSNTGAYTFTNLRPSDASGYTVTETGGVPAIFLDGKDTVQGSLGGNRATVTSRQVTAIPLTAGASGVNYNFGEIQPASLAGLIYVDVANAGEYVVGDPTLAGVSVTLTGTDDLGDTVSIATTTSSTGTYNFTGLRPGTYSLIEAATPQYVDGATTVGTVNGAADGTGATNTVTNIGLEATNSGIGYNFGELQNADLQITKTDGKTSATPGTSDTYTIVVTNAGPSDVTGASVSDPFPSTFTGVSFTATGTTGASGFTTSGTGNIADTVNLASGASITYVATGTISSAATGNLINTVTVTAPGGVTDPNPGNNSATDTDTLTPTADLQITKTDGKTTATPGTSDTYTIVVTNAGPSDVTGASVSDPFPSTFTGVSFTATGTTGASGFTASGSGNIADTVNLASGASITYVATGTISPTATGTLSNTATVTAPAGVTDPNPDNNSATDTDTLGPTADLQITKTDGKTTATPGTSDTYTIVVTNAGPSAVVGAAIADPFPATFTGVTFTATGTTGASGFTTSGTGNIADTVNLASGASITYVATGTISSAATGNLINTVTVTAPAGVTDPNPGNNSATDTDTLTPTADLQITKTDGKTTATPGTSDTYTIVVTNAGPSAVVGAAIADPFPATFTGVTFTATGTSGASGFTTSGTGNIADTVNLASGASITYVATGTISPTATGTLSNTATVTAPAGVTDPNPGNNSATDTDTLTPTADLQITKTDGKTSATPGTSDTYTIVVTNAGPSAVVGAAIADPFPATFTAVTFTATGTSGASGFTASGSGNIADTVNLASGASITYVATGTISPTATGTLSNTATVTAPAGVTDPNPDNNSATDTDTLGPTADLQITKTDGKTTATPGTSDTYTIVVTNAGPSAVVGAAIADPFPATFTGVTFTATGTTGASGFTASGSGNIADTVNLASGASITYVATGTISPTATGTLSNTATVTAPAGVTDPNPGNNSATDTDTLTPTADLQITKTDGKTSATPGTSDTYTIVVTNAGPSAVVGAAIADPFPATFTAVTFTATGTSGASGFTASGSGNIADTVNLASGASITYVAMGTISPTATGTLSNTATVTAPAGVTDPNPDNNSATDTDTLGPTADLQITKTDGKTTATPGTSDTYTIVVTNAGPSAVVGAAIADPFPATFTGVTFTATGSAGASGFTTSGTGNIADTVNLASGASITYVATGTISPTATGTLSNTATVTAPAGVTDPNAGNNSATDTDTLTPTVDLQITNTDGKTTVIPGTLDTYTIVVSNNGPSDVTGATVSDPFPSNFTGVTFTATGTMGASGFTTSGSGNITDTVNLASGASITYIATGTVSSAATGNLTTTATVTAPSGTTETNTANNSATDTDTLAPTADLQITKTDGKTTATPGTSDTYTIVVTNAGPSAVVGAAIADPFPATFTAVTFTATGTSGASGFTASGSGNIADAVNLASGASITYVATGTISPTATGTLSNTATVTAPAGVTDPNPGNNSATDTDTLTPTVDLQITNTDGKTTVIPGTLDTYTIVVSNNGPSDVTGATVSDPFPSNFTGVTFTATGTMGASGFTTSGSGNIADTVNLASGASITYIATGTVSSAATGNLTTTATVTAPSGTTETNTANNSATDTDTLTPTADLQITKTDGKTTATPGTSDTYTIVVTNAGPSAVVGAAIADPFPATFTGVTFTATGTSGASGFTTSGTGNIADTVNLASGASITYVATGAISSAATGNLINTATVTAPAGVTDPNPGNNSATDTDTLGPTADLTIVKTDNGATQPGQPIIYTIVVFNNGPSTVTNASVADMMPVAITSDTWTATASSGASVAMTSGTGNIATTGSLISGSHITFTVTANISLAAVGTLANTATVTPPTGVTDPNPGNNSSTDTVTLTPLDPTSSLAGVVYVDENHNNVRDAGDPGLPGVTVTLTGQDLHGDTVNVSAITDANGNYTFQRMLAGTYQLTETPPPIFLTGANAVGTLGGVSATHVISSITVGLNQSGVDYQFSAITLPSSMISKSLFLASTPGIDPKAGSGIAVVNPAAADPSGTVYVDLNQDGKHDSGDLGLAGVQITLTGTTTDGSIVPRTTTTNSEGYYQFGNLSAGVYALNESAPAGYRNGAETTGTLGGTAAANRFTNIILGPNDNGTGYNFGELPLTTPQTNFGGAPVGQASIGGLQNGLDLLPEVELPSSNKLWSAYVNSALIRLGGLTRLGSRN